jgi:uncharacterized lipoprotein YddW (UPF0748 family)
MAAALAVIVSLFVMFSLGSAQENPAAYMPLVAKAPPTPTPSPTPTPAPTATPTPQPPPGSMTEFRGLWVTRFDWTSLFSVPADPARIDEIVDNTAAAGFNVILFQVRGTADALYTPGLEPWSDRLTGALGQNPGWDPLARMIDRAHARGIQVHAYINVYPVWTGCDPPPDGTVPRHFYYLLRDAHGVTPGASGDRLNGLQWNTGDEVDCSSYQRATPASVFTDNHLMSVAADIIDRYDVDGLHLDHIRYAGQQASCDPVSEASYGTDCFGYNGGPYTYEQWQRRQVNGTVGKFYELLASRQRELWLSAAVWPDYDIGYNRYYQDSKAWLQGGYIDSISPMIYPGSGVYNCPDDSNWTQADWQARVADFQATSGGRYVIPGIGTGYCTFDEIVARINAARAIGTAGQALFSYGELAAKGYFDDLAAGPYATPAVVPDIPWHD